MTLVSFVAAIKPAAIPAARAHQADRVRAYLQPAPTSAARKKTRSVSWM